MAQNIQINYQDGSKVFFTSDTHWGHKAIIGFCKRPFQDVEEMDKALIDKWNEVVPPDGVVFHLGDFAWHGDWTSIRKQLNGRIILVQGNHDRKNKPRSQKVYQSLFEGIFQQLYLQIEGRKLYLNHYPFLCYGGTYRNPKDMVWQLHGHTHFGELSSTGRDNDRLKMCFPTQYDVGVDNNNFKPISWTEVKKIIDQQVKESTNYCNVNIETVAKICSEL